MQEEKKLSDYELFVREWIMNHGSESIPDEKTWRRYFKITWLKA